MTPGDLQIQNRFYPYEIRINEVNSPDDKYGKIQD